MVDVVASHAESIAPLNAADERAARLVAEADSRRYRFLTKAIPQIVWTSTPDGRLDSFNARWGEYTGGVDKVSPDRDWADVLHPDDAPRWQEGWDRARAARSTFTIDVRLRRADGAYRWHLARALPVLDRPARSIKKWLGTCTDIDDQKRAEGMLAFLAEVSTVLASSLDYKTTMAAVARLAVPHVADWCVVDILETDGSIRRLAVAHAEPSMVEVGWTLARLYPTDPSSSHPVARSLRSGQIDTIYEVDDDALKAMSKDDDHLTLLRSIDLKSIVTVPLVARGRFLGAILFGMAESARRYSSGDIPLIEDLARRSALAVDNARLYREAQTAREEAEAANRAKDEFLAVLGHELRTPLTPILAEVSALLDDAETPEPLRPFLAMTRRNIELEARLIDDLLDLGRIAQGKVQLRRKVADLHELVEQAVDICRADAERVGLSLRFVPTAGRRFVDVDPAKFLQILWNLIKNAIKFTPEGGSIVVRSRADGEDGWVAVDVADTGLGVTAESIERIFAPFEQGGAGVTQRFGGLGLGLAIGRSFAQALGGKLSARSEGPNRGSTFTLELPTVGAPPGTRPGDADEPRLDPSASKPRRAIRLLVVEDDPDTVRVLSRLLGKRGYQVASAGGIAEAVERAREQRFDIVLSDLGLSDGSGLDLLGRLGADRPPVAIALSGSALVDDIRRSLDAGFVEHLVKPIDFATLESRLIEHSAHLTID